MSLAGHTGRCSGGAGPTGGRGRSRSGRRGQWKRDYCMLNKRRGAADTHCIQVYKVVIFHSFFFITSCKLQVRLVAALSLSRVASFASWRHQPNWVRIHEEFIICNTTQTRHSTTKTRKSGKRGTPWHTCSSDRCSLVLANQTNMDLSAWVQWPPESHQSSSQSKFPPDGKNKVREQQMYIFSRMLIMLRTVVCTS